LEVERGRLTGYSYNDWQVAFFVDEFDDPSLLRLRRPRISVNHITNDANDAEFEEERRAERILLNLKLFFDSFMPFARLGSDHRWFTY
jgi:hypothetical protein